MAAGCQRTVYVCDDGKDKFKRRMCQRMGREVIRATWHTHHSPSWRSPSNARSLTQNVQALPGHASPFAFVSGCSGTKQWPWRTQVQYISGRTRPSGETNGKSGNLNNACRQIYPAGCKIPDHEVICVMDADQVCWCRWECFSRPFVTLYFSSL